PGQRPRGTATRSRESEARTGRKRLWAAARSTRSRAVSGAFMLPRIRAKLSSNAMLLIASIVYAAALVALVLVPNAVVILVVRVATGIAWIAVLSSMNAAMHLFLPAWVRARGLSVYQMVLFGAQ